MSGWMDLAKRSSLSATMTTQSRNMDGSEGRLGTLLTSPIISAGIDECSIRAYCSCRVPTLVGILAFFNFGKKKVGILMKSGNFPKYLNSFLITEQNDV